MELVYHNIDPVAFWLGSLPVRWYALAYMAGFLLGWQYCLHLVRRESDSRPNSEDVDDFLPWAILGVILGGRIGYVLFYNFDSYMNAPLEALKLWHGGMSFHGGALGVIAALIIYSLIKKFNPFRLADIVCAAVPIGLFFGRIANFINGELFGRITDAPWGMVFPRGGDFPRHPSQLYEAALEGAVLFLILFVLIRMPAVRARPGIVSGVFLAGYGIFRAFVELFRAPDIQIGFVFAHVSMGQLLSAPMIAAGLGLVLYAAMGKTCPKKV